MKRSITVRMATAVAIQPGQTIEVDIRGLGTLRNPVAAAPSVAATLPPPFERR